MEKDLFEPIKNIKFISRDDLKPNDYNPNKVLEKNLKLLMQSILTNGFCFPIVVREDMTIIDGFHRWLVCGREPLKTRMDNTVPVVIVKHDDESKNMYGTITFNRARGTHLLEPMEKIVQKLFDQGKTVGEISKELGMSNEEVFRLSKIDRDTFLDIVVKRQEFSKAQISRGMK